MFFNERSLSVFKIYCTVVNEINNARQNDKPIYNLTKSPLRRTFIPIFKSYVEAKPGNYTKLNILMNTITS